MGLIKELCFSGVIKQLQIQEDCLLPALREAAEISMVSPFLPQGNNESRLKQPS
jgi:hypothetical protein